MRNRTSCHPGHHHHHPFRMSYEPKQTYPTQLGVVLTPSLYPTYAIVESHSRQCRAHPYQRKDGNVATSAATSAATSVATLPSQTGRVYGTRATDVKLATKSCCTVECASMAPCTPYPSFPPTLIKFEISIQHSAFSIQHSAFSIQHSWYSSPIPDPDRSVADPTLFTPSRVATHTLFMPGGRALSHWDGLTLRSSCLASELEHPL
jgi:hypothetical protein